MTPLRKRMIDDMVSSGLSANTQATYIQSLRGLAKHYHRSPGELSEAEVRSYLLHLRDERGVTIRHKERSSGRWLRTGLTGHEFMRRFLQHVLPKGLHKIRYYGLWHPSRREQAARARLLLQLDQPAAAHTTASTGVSGADASVQSSVSSPVEPMRVCPSCKEGRLVEVGRLYPKQASGP